MKAERFKLIVSGEYQGRPYQYQEEVPAKDYQLRGWKLKFAGPKKEYIQQLNNAEKGQHFVWEEAGCRTEIIAL